MLVMMVLGQGIAPDHERLEHSQVGITLNTYSHVLPGLGASLHKGEGGGRATERRDEGRRSRYRTPRRATRSHVAALPRHCEYWRRTIVVGVYGYYTFSALRNICQESVIHRDEMAVPAVPRSITLSTDARRRWPSDALSSNLAMDARHRRVVAAVDSPGQRSNACCSPKYFVTPGSAIPLGPPRVHTSVSPRSSAWEALSAARPQRPVRDTRGARRRRHRDDEH